MNLPSTGLATRATGEEESPPITMKQFQVRSSRVNFAFLPCPVLFVALHDNPHRPIWPRCQAFTAPIPGP